MGIFGLFKKQVDQPVIYFSVWLIPHRQINPGFFVHNALIMRESFKTLLSMIASHAAFTKSAKWHFTGGQVDDHIVDTSASEATFRCDFIDYGPILGENIKCQGVCHRIYFVDNFIHRGKSKKRHYRTKNFFLHNCIFERYMIHYGRFNL